MITPRQFPRWKTRLRSPDEVRPPPVTPPRWTMWPPTRALLRERGELEEPAPEAPAPVEPPVVSAIEPRLSVIDPQYPVFGNPLTATVRANFAAARDEIEELQRRVSILETLPGLGVVDGGTW